MEIAIIDAELCFKGIYSELGKHRFPNLCSMKISGYYKEKGDNVTLITELPNISQLNSWNKKYDRIYISKVFVETCVPTELLRMSNVIYGGTGFWFANAQPLNYKIEHSMPDYHLYDDWIKERKTLKSATDEFSYYENYSMRFSTRGCIRQCKFCINQHCTEVIKASPIKEFLDVNRNYICLLDDNVLAYKDWKEIFNELNDTGKTFEFKQGLDIRALTEEKVEVIAKSKININTLYFAFDSIKDKEIIEEKLKLWRQHYRKNTHMYVLCGFDETNRYDEEFWAKDIQSTLERIAICIKYGVFPYVMRYRMWNNAGFYRGMYIVLSSWCNQKSLFSKLSLNEWGDKIQKANEKQLKNKRLYSSKRYLMEYAGKHPELAYKYFDLKYNENNEFSYEKDNIVIANKKITKICQKNTIEKKINLIQKVNSIIPIKNDKKPINLEDLFIHCKSYITKFYEGIIIPFNKKSLKSIPEKIISLTLINFKDKNIVEIDKELLLFIQRYLKSKCNLFIFNTNLKSFTIIKEFIENFTNLKFVEVTTFKIGDSKHNMNYCSRYILKDNDVKNIFNNTMSYSRIILLNDIIKNTTTKNNIALNLFEQSKFLSMLDKEYNPQWISLRKKQKSFTRTAINYIKEQNSNQQIAISDAQDKDIG